jgi:hypothetical protein
MSKNNSNAMLFKGNFPSCTNLKNFNSLFLSNGFPHLFGATFLLKMTETSPQSFMSLDGSISKIEVDPTEEASVVEVFQDVLDKLSGVRKTDKLLQFFKLVQDGKFPLNNIAFVNRMNRPPNNFLPNQKNWRVDGEFLI